MLSHDCLLVAGDDATAFLQAQLTQDLDRVPAGGGPCLAAWCNPKGRAIALFRLRRLGKTWRLALPDAMSAAVRQRLETFRFRARFRIDIEAATADDLDLAGRPTEAEWRSRLVADGIPILEAGQTERFFSTASIRPGDRLKANGRDAGEVVNVAGGEFLAVVPLDTERGSIAGETAEVLPLPYTPDA